MEVLVNIKLLKSYQWRKQRRMGAKNLKRRARETTKGRALDPRKRIIRISVVSDFALVIHSDSYTGLLQMSQSTNPALDLVGNVPL